MFDKRLNRLRVLYKENNFDGVLMANPANIYYYTGFYGDESKVLVCDDYIALLTDGRYTEQAAKECPDVPLLVQGVENGSWIYLLEKACRANNVKSLAFEGDFVTYKEFASMEESLRQIKLYDSRNIISAGRVVKDETEIKLLRKVAEIGDRVLESVEKYLKPGITEKELAREIDYAFLKFGAEGLSFPTIVAAGENGAKPHAKPSDYQFKAGDFVTIDMGGRYKGYCGDMTRTFVIGFTDDKHKELYDLVLSAQDYAEKHIKAGMTTGEADALARNILVKAGYGEYFSHSLGHGVGLEIHELPSLRSRDEYILQAGNVVTVEPGLYISGFGGLRIENTVVITQNGAVPLNKYPKNLKVF
ncbi:MAG: M24 family metallopeptidase [Bacillota bacterium]|jgi:Xaa-Pro aminopeptidase